MGQEGGATGGRGGGGGGGNGGSSGGGGGDGGGRRGDGSRDRKLLESRSHRIPVIARPQRPRHAVGEPVQRQEQRVAGRIGLSPQAVNHAARPHERRAELKHERRAGE